MEGVIDEVNQEYIPKGIQPYTKPGLSLILLLSGGAVLYSFIKRLVIRAQVKVVLSETQRRRSEQLQSLKERLQKAHLPEVLKKEILSLDLVQLQKRLKDRTLKSIDVLRAYQTKALEAQGKINCIAAVIEEAEELAYSCDSLPIVTKPLHGIPISLKENIVYKGLHQTSGLVSLLLQPPAEEDSVLVKCLKELGAIPFVTTNVPQSLMSISCNNNIYGQTKNPHNQEHCPGGSSGGEAALIGYGGSILGIGTDIGGSIRIPSHFCGVYGFKTTTSRFGIGSLFKARKEQILVETSTGPMAQTAEGLVVALKALFSQTVFDIDYQISPILFQNNLYDSKQPLRIGYYLTDNIVNSTASCRRAILMAKKALEARGHKVVEFTPPRLMDAVCLTCRIIMSDGYILGRLVRHESATKELFISKATEGLKCILSPLLQPIDPVTSRVLKSMDGHRNYQDIFNLVSEKEKYEKEFAAALKEDHLDAIISPVFASPSVKISCPGLGRFPSYALLYNLLNYPGVSMPVTKVTEEEANEQYTATNILEYFMKSSIPGSAGLPVSVQIMVPKYKDELALRLMMEMDSELKKKSS
ncbi:fatty-acid amide hydrolase 1-like [Argonauta hians]